MDNAQRASTRREGLVSVGVVIAQAENVKQLLLSSEELHPVDMLEMLSGVRTIKQELITLRGAITRLVPAEGGDQSDRTTPVSTPCVEVDALPAEREAALYYRVLPDGRDLAVYPLSLAWGQLALSSGGLEYGGIDHSFYYATRAQAIDAAKLWDGNGDAPVGWFRHPQSGRRRESGDPNKETYQP